MILDGLMFIAFSLMGMVMELLPNADPTTTTYISSQFGVLKSALNTINWFFPVDQLYIVLGFVFVIEFYGLTSKILFWILENVSLGLFKSPK
jgi:hypothetical protein